MIINEDENGKPLADENWQLVDTGSNVILEGRDEIEAETGRLEWDTIYDTDYVTTTDNLSEAEEDAIWNAYLNEEYMSDELKDAICTLKDKKRVSSIKRYPTNLHLDLQESGYTLDFDGQVGQFTRDEWKEDLEERGFCPLSVEKILDYLDSFCYTNTEDFFKEDE